MRGLENSILGKYELSQEIGRGSMGTVYAGYDSFADRKVAVKIAIPDAMGGEENDARHRKLFFNEAKVAGMLRHPNIVSVFDAGVEGDIWYIAMEFVPGGHTLYDHCRPANLLDVESVVRVAFKCARAVDYAHRQGVVHRDIKPRNILLSENGDVKIGDFSIALMNQAETTDTQVHGYVGSPLYMSPEQVREEQVTNQSDLFSLGVVLYELLAGKHPFGADSLPAIIHQIISKDPPPVTEARQDTPPVLVHILERCLRKDLQHRYKAGLDLAADLSLVFDHLQLLDEQVSEDEKFKQVKQLKFFADFSESEIWEVINASGWLDYQPEQQIIVEGEVESFFYVIVNGEVQVTKSGNVVDALGTGDCFGEMGFIAHRERTATIVAKSEVTALKVRASLIEKASVYCQLRFNRAFLYALIERLSRTTKKFSDKG